MNKKLFFGVISAVLLFSVYVLLDTFVLTTVYGTAKTETTVTAGAAEASAPEAARETVITGTGYDDGTVSITLTETDYLDTAVYVAKVVSSDPARLATALAKGLYGKNVTDETSEIAADAGAILAINGDFYGAREAGYVLRNGILYRATAVKGREDLVIFEDGHFEIITETDVTAEALLARGARQILSFGPALVENGAIAVSAGEEVGRAMASNPRTAIGIDGDGNWVFVVSDGRTDESEGLTLSELAAFMKDLGCVTAYNLDGGGSSTMVFNGVVINQPTTSGRSVKERSVSDIVCITA
ncbi:MAG: phosphodiester glycosidase family protein [Clostridia bacterium]|nr:phosphodiester glycosidase family protein [Clostridia bacterium]